MRRELSGVKETRGIGGHGPFISSKYLPQSLPGPWDSSKSIYWQHIFQMRKRERKEENGIVREREREKERGKGKEKGRKEAMKSWDSWSIFGPQIPEKVEHIYSTCSNIIRIQLLSVSDTQLNNKILIGSCGEYHHISQ